jgi:ATPase subunit of ABC transporter with duplicated ATPase domains
MRGAVADRPMRVLSMGERTKVEIVAMMLAGANVLILDEPTNHLDLLSVEALEVALRGFPGAILFTSHDRRFVEALATATLELGSGVVSRESDVSNNRK